ncbi:MAG: ribosome biogenesis GTPase YlqF [Synechococcaceae bacterium WB8_1B_136]|nr:ribosome biogenesis GTPase YlqF [Synechococcaceae bacterium WB8_1B_136]
MEADLLSSAAPAIQWYPGHIAKAERSLTDNLAKVDLVIEVRDARIPTSTGHPRLQRWIQGKQHLLVINRRDMVSAEARQQWDAWFRSRGQTPWWCDAKAGTGVKQLQQAAIRAGEALNARRAGRGMKPRPVRALMLGFPNVGKSALINRLVRQKVVDSARRAGVTRSLRWVRLGQDLDLLDAPGVLPPRLDNQLAALRLALCDDIGQAAYDGEAVAKAFVQVLAELEAVAAAGVPAGLLERRYGLAVPALTAAGEGPRLPAVSDLPNGVQLVQNPEDAGDVSPARASRPDASAWLEAAAARHTSGDTARMAQRLLDDFRRGILGPIALELP